MRLRKKQALRIVSSVLAASMALSAFPTAAFAAGTPQKTEAENSAVETQAEDSQDIRQRSCNSLLSHFQCQLPQICAN